MEKDKDIELFEGGTNPFVQGQQLFFDQHAVQPTANTQQTAYSTAKPRKPISAYLQFAVREREAIKHSLRLKATSKRVQKELRKRWLALNRQVKDTYLQEARRQEEEYKKQMHALKQSLQSEKYFFSPESGQTKDEVPATRITELAAIMRPAREDDLRSVLLPKNQVIQPTFEFVQRQKQNDNNRLFQQYTAHQEHDFGPQVSHPLLMAGANHVHYILNQKPLPELLIPQTQEAFFQITSNKDQNTINAQQPNVFSKPSQSSKSFL